MGALSNLVNGYSGKADVARLVNMFHVALLALGCEWYGEWVPSKANLADIMTRPERFHELEAGIARISSRPIREFDMELPPLGAGWGDLKAWMRMMRAARAQQ